MSSAIKNAGKEEWTYFGAFNADNSDHDLPANWTTLYIHVSLSSYSDAILLLRDALPSNSSIYVNGTKDTMITVKKNTNKINVTKGTAKVYYK